MMHSDDELKDRITQLLNENTFPRAERRASNRLSVKTVMVGALAVFACQLGLIVYLLEAQPRRSVIERPQLVVLQNGMSAEHRKASLANIVPLLTDRECGL